MSNLDINNLPSALSINNLKKKGKLITEKLSDNINIIKNNIINKDEEPILTSISSINNDNMPNNDNMFDIYGLFKKLGYIIIIFIIMMLVYSLYMFSNYGINILKKWFDKGKNIDLYDKKDDDDDEDEDLNKIKHDNILKINKLNDDINKMNITNKNEYKPKQNDILNNIKKQWCYLGIDRGYRSCVKTDENLCMSGKIFPRKDICIHPNLRMN